MSGTRADNSSPPDLGMMRYARRPYTGESTAQARTHPMNEAAAHGDVRDMIARQLVAVLSAEWPAARELAIADLHRTSTGLSRENWVFEAQWRDHSGARSQRMILRRDPPASLLLTDRRWEFRVLRALQNTAVPAPPQRGLDGVRGS